MFSIDLILSMDSHKQKEILDALETLQATGLIAAQKHEELLTLETRAGGVDDRELVKLIRVYRARITELSQLEDVIEQLKRNQ